MTNFGDLIASNGRWLALVVAFATVLVILAWRARERRIRRDKRRVRRLARQRVWDWLMLRPQVRRLTHQPGEDQV